MIYKTVEIPHLRHTVKFLDLSVLQGVEIKGSAYTAVEDNDTTLVFIEDIEKNVKNIDAIPHIAHELVHVLQILCEKMSTNIEHEKEHTAYLMHYLLSEVCGEQ